MCEYYLKVHWCFQAIDSTQHKVTGDVRLQLFKGNVIVKGRRSPFSKYNISLVSFDEIGDYNQRDAEGFIKINSLRLKHWGKQWVSVMT